MREAVEYWMEHYRQALSSCVNSRSHSGHTAFGIACESAIDSEHLWQRASMACAVALSSLPTLDPCVLSVAEHTHLSLACYAGMNTLVHGWLASGRVSKDTVQHQGTDGCTAFISACDTCHSHSKPSGDPALAAAACACALALVNTGWVEPGTSDKSRQSHLQWAACAGLPEAVQYWMERCPEAVGACTNAQDKRGRTAFVAAAELSRKDSTREARLRHMTGALAVATHPAFDPCDLSYENQAQFAYACYAGLDGLVQSWLRSGRVGKQTVQHLGWDGCSPYQLACTTWLKSTEHGGDRVLAASARACAVALANTGWVDPATAEVPGQPMLSNLMKACLAGMYIPVL